MSAHTPGPWTWTEDRCWGGYSGIVGPNNQEVFYPNTANNGDDGAAWFEDLPSEADRALIAAAPDLLEALKRTLNFIENNESEFGITLESGDIARAAIAKATGAST